MLFAYFFMLYIPLCTITQGNQETKPNAPVSQEAISPYVCAKCSLLLFSHESKFQATEEMLSFTRPIFPVNVTYSRLDTFTPLIAISCSGCSNHLGVIYNDGPGPIYKRFSVHANAVVQRY